MQDRSPLWQPKLMEELSALLSRDPAASGAVVIGSCAREDVCIDPWSDLDLAILIEDSARERYCPVPDWAEQLGSIYTTSLSRTDDYSVARICYTDGRRIDLIVITNSSLKRVAEWQMNPLCHGGIPLFSRSNILDAVLRENFPPPICNTFSDARLEQMANEFWFKGMLAVSKIGRKELLIALHLSLDMVRDCLLLGMVLRDRATGTNHHRDGVDGNHFVAMLEGTSRPYTDQGILDTIEQSAIVFDSLADKWKPGYPQGRYPLLEWIASARKNNASHKSYKEKG